MESEIIKKGAILEGGELETEYKVRRRTKLEKSIDINIPVPEGWDLKREFKTRKRIFREKSVSLELEDKTWRLFYELGTPRIATRDFAILLRTRNGVDKTKQIDVLAIDDEVVFIVECKSQEKPGKCALLWSRSWHSPSGLGVSYATSEKSLSFPCLSLAVTV